VVTSSVQIAGVLLIFSFLIVPAVCGLMLASTFRASLFVGWGIGVGVSLIGAALSYQWDLPTGAAIVCTFGITLLLVALVKRVVNVA
jgi:zinc/manganese transport system permease protein